MASREAKDAAHGGGTAREKDVGRAAAEVEGWRAKGKLAAALHSQSSSRGRGTTAKGAGSVTEAAFLGPWGQQGGGIRALPFPE